jgi:hypothetical protein
MSIRYVALQHEINLDAAIDPVVLSVFGPTLV